MDSFEWNKIAGGVLASVLFVLVLRVGVEAVYHAEAPAKPGYDVPGVQETQMAGAAAPAAEVLPDFATVLPAADVNNGAMVAERCAACHDWSKGGPNKIGPNLYGVVDRERGKHPGFAYSPAMANKGGTWTYEDLFKYLAQPAIFIPGNKMAFAGLPRTKDRLDVIAFLRMQADTPAPLPPPAPAAPAPTDAAPAGDATTAPAPAGAPTETPPTPAPTTPAKN